MITSDQVVLATAKVPETHYGWFVIISENTPTVEGSSIEVAVSTVWHDYAVIKDGVRIFYSEDEKSVAAYFNEIMEGKA